VERARECGLVMGSDPVQLIIITAVWFGVWGQ